MPNKRAIELGIPVSTAWGRLRKQLLFHLAQECGKTDCFRCGEAIEGLSEFSIEHKEPWEGISAEKFWDLENIAFSHLRCNIKHGRKPLKKEGPEGTLWCCYCKKFLPLESFSRKKTNPRHGTGRNTICKKCNTRRVQSWRSSKN